MVAARVVDPSSSRKRGRGRGRIIAESQTSKVEGFSTFIRRIGIRMRFFVIIMNIVADMDRTIELAR